jgi:hypothetical protein
MAGSPQAPHGASPGVLESVRWARAKGFALVPVIVRAKAVASTHANYTDKQYNSPNPDFWEQNDYGAGVLTGPSRKGPTDVDIDHPDGLPFAEIFLPKTDCVFGRKSAPRSHWFYICPSSPAKRMEFKDPFIATERKTIVEFRGDGAENHTILPGSIHPSGETYRWETTAVPLIIAETTEDVLLRAVKKIAAATLLARYAWEPGDRDQPAMHISGMFCNLGWSEEETLEMMEAVMSFHGDKDPERTRKAVATTYKRKEAGKKNTGATKLKAHLRDKKEIIDLILEWFGAFGDTIVETYNESFSVIRMDGRVFVTAKTKNQLTFMPVGEFKKWRCNDLLTIGDEEIPKASIWLKSQNRKEFENTTFDPSGKESTDTELNLWQGWAVAPIGGDCSAWCDVFKTVLCGGNEEKYKLGLAWFADIIQDPSNKPGTALVFVSDEGAVKSVFLEYFAKILGFSFLSISDQENITGKFNDHLKNMLLIQSEEAIYAPEKKHRSVLRSLITDRYFMAMKKFGMPEQARSYARIIFTSNDPQAAPIARTDRRYIVFDASGRKMDGALKDRFFAEMKAQGPQALLHFLQNYAYEKDMIRTNIKDKEHEAMKIQNFNETQEWWHQILQAGDILPKSLKWATDDAKADWPFTVGKTALWANFRDNYPRSRVSRNAWGAELAKMLGGAVPTKQVRFIIPLDFRERTPIPERQDSFFGLPPLDACRKSFDAYMQTEITWSGVDSNPLEEKQPDDTQDM